MNNSKLHHCINKPLSFFDKLQLYADYIGAISGVVTILILNSLGRLPNWTIYSFWTGILLCAPFEYIQPRLGWVYYYKCITYKLAPFKIMWIIHAIWDSFILYIIMYITYTLWGEHILRNFVPSAALFMSFLGMAQEIVIECYETLWYYIPTKFNPTWAVIRGRNMTLQQWHWSILPIAYYMIFLYYTYHD